MAGKRIAVVGGGIFGCATASLLASNGFNVDLFEQGEDLMQVASSINQYRLHHGYHYPRSIETALACLKGLRSFKREFSSAIVECNRGHYYGIAKRDSLVSGAQYKDFMKATGLPFEEVQLDVLREENLDLQIRANEALFDPRIVKQISIDRLRKFGVVVHLGVRKTLEELDAFDFIINATYRNYNEITPPETRIDLQFELCEKPVIRLGNDFAERSIVIMDGPFMCFDPLPGTDYHVAGNVVHAIHNASVGIYPEIPKEYKAIVDRGIILKERLKISAFDEFIESAERFFRFVHPITHIGSMFTVRTVLPFSDYDDSRPTLVSMPSDRILNIFSGKICTCVEAAEQATGMIVRKLVEG